MAITVTYCPKYLAMMSSQNSGIRNPLIGYFFSLYKIKRIKLATTYSHVAFRYTTIGAAMFHFRVRDGNGWFHYAMVTRIHNLIVKFLNIEIKIQTVTSEGRLESDGLEAFSYCFSKNGQWDQ